MRQQRAASRSVDRNWRPDVLQLSLRFRPRHDGTEMSLDLSAIDVKEDHREIGVGDEVQHQAQNNTQVVSGDATELIDPPWLISQDVYHSVILKWNVRLTVPDVAARCKLSHLCRNKGMKEVGAEDGKHFSIADCLVEDAEHSIRGTQCLLFSDHDGGYGCSQVTQRHPSLPQSSTMNVALEATASKKDDGQRSRLELRRRHA